MSSITVCSIYLKIEHASVFKFDYMEYNGLSWVSDKSLDLRLPRGHEPAYRSHIHACVGPDVHKCGLCHESTAWQLVRYTGVCSVRIKCDGTGNHPDRKRTPNGSPRPIKGELYADDSRHTTVDTCAIPKCRTS